MNVYVGKTEKKGEDGLYHNYVIETKPGQFLEHREKRDTPDGSWRKCGDYYTGSELFCKANAIKVKPSECTPSIGFEERGMVTTIPSGDDHAEGGISYFSIVVDKE